MSVSVTIRGTGYTLMQDRDEDYGTYGTTLLNAMIGAINASLFIETGTRLSRIDYTGATGTNTQSILFGSSGTGVNGDASIGIRNVNGALQYKEAGGNWTDIGTALSANTDLSNLSATVAVNDDINPDTNNTLTLGTDLKEWQTLFARLIQHGDATNPDLEISTISDNGDIKITPHGTGEIILDGTIEIENGVIEETTNDLVIKATGAGKDITIEANTDILVKGATVALDSASDIVTTDIGGTALPLVYSATIQDYTVVGSVGDALQQFAGRDSTLAELEAYFTAANVLAYYRFGAGAALVTDEKAAYNLSLPGGGADPVNGTGIMGTAFDADFVSSDYFTQATLLDVTPAAIAINFWMKATDGQPAANMCVFDKTNDETVGSCDGMAFYIQSAGPVGGMRWMTWANVAVGSSSDLYTSTLLPNGTTGWYMITLNWDTVNGKRIWVNDRLENQDIAATTLPANGTTRDFTMGVAGRGGVPVAGSYFTGSLANFAVMNKTLTQEMVDFLYATTVPIPAALQGKDFDMKAIMRPQAAAGGERQVHCDEVLRTSTEALISGGTRRSTDYYKITGKF